MNFYINAHLLVGFFLAMIRASAWLFITPPFSSNLIPSTVKAGLAIALGLAAAPRIAPHIINTGFVYLIGAITTQVITGISIGFIIMVLLSAIQSSGAIINLFGGLAVPPQLDPLSGQQTPLLGQFYELIALVLLFAMNADLLLVKGFFTSFDAIGLNLASMGPLSAILTHDLATLFVSALEIGAPLLAVLFLAQVVLGLLTLAAPQLNAFSMGFPLQILLTLILLGLGIHVIPQALAELVSRSLQDMGSLLQKG